ncbi:MAG: hypothetical protein ABIM89_17110 [Mycobacteriales bacterium]
MTDDQRYADLLEQARGFGGYVSLGQATAAGLSESEVATLVRRGDWLHVGPGLRRVVDYASDDGWRDRVRAALLSAGPGAVAAGHTAAALQGVVGSPPGARIWLAVPPDRHPEHRAGIRLLRSPVPAADVVEVDGIPVTAPLRAVLDSARYADHLAAVCLFESAIRQDLFEFGAVLAAANALHGKRGSIAVRKAFRRIDLRSESPLETRARLLLVDAGFRYPRLQVQVAPGDARRIDLAYLAPRQHAYRGLAIEIDGREVHAREDAFHSDPVRQTALEEADWLVRRFTSRHLSDPAYVCQTVRRALARAGC